MKFVGLAFAGCLLLAGVPAFADAGTAPPLSVQPDAAPGDQTLQDTLSWMDYTYNPHVSSGSFGHGLKEVYNSSGNTNMFSRVTEDFTYTGCQIELHLQDDPNSSLVGIHTKSVQTFDLRDIDPKSIEIHKFDSHENGEECRDPEVVRAMHMSCDSAEISFATRGKRPLITVVTQPEESDKSGVRGGPTKTMESTALFEVNNPDYADRFGQAFAHAIDLCSKSP